MAEPIGIDVAWNKPAAQAVKDAGYVFVLGYLSTDPSKNMTAAYVGECHAAGLGVGLVWETAASRAAQGAAAGSSDGQLAAGQARALGAPESTCLFWAVDFDGQPGQVLPYGAAFRAAVRPFRSGPYGSDSVIGGVRASGLADVCWQTCAWSDGRVNPAAALYQRQKHTVPPIRGVAVGDYDEDVQLLGDAGLWLPPAPAPAPVPAPMTTSEEDDMAHVYLVRAQGDGRWYEANLDTWRKRYVPSPAIANALTFGGIASDKGAPFVWPPETVDWLIDETPGGSPKPEPVQD